MGVGRLMLWVAAIAISTTQVQGCPSGCNCSQTTVGFSYRIRANCSYLGLSEVPSEDDMWENDVISVMQLVSNNISIITNVSFYNMDNLVAIDLEQNQISEVESGAFARLTKLIGLDMSKNKITYLHPETFINNDMLLFLDLSYNMLSVPTDNAFLISDSHIMIGLAACNLQHVSEITFSRVPNLLTLDLSSNNLQDFNLTILDDKESIKVFVIRNNSQVLSIEGSFPSALEKLDLSGTVFDLKKISFPYRNSLEMLNLNGCNLTEAPKTILERLTNLEELQLNNNNITHFDTATMNIFRGLRRLHLENNSISSIEMNTFDKTYIWKLVLSGNPIDFPESGPFFKAPFLQELEMRSCSISHIGNESFQEMKSLNYTDLSYNHIKLISRDAFIGLRELTTLLLQNNEIVTIERDSFLHNIKLTTLNLSGNPLVIPSDAPLLSAPSLKTLALAACGFTQLPLKVFSHSLHLNTLDISSNKFQFIDVKVFSKMKKLQSLNMFNNPFICDFQLRPLWLLCLDRNINCSASCGPEKGSWIVLEDVTAPEGTEDISTTTASTVMQPAIGDSKSEKQYSSGQSVASAVMLMLSLGFIVGVVVGLISGCVFLQKYLGINRREDAVYHSVASESITAESLQNLCVNDTS
ncbi:leucine-rich repeat-containing protein 15-like [Anabrus simplex]|uniref:leucine-rich repeat-containing protein 15-like n=1 Tax=Anabrus simplex TaxID=316456 RepID=UPI0035A28DF8